jgi:hypothetical protein
MNVEIGAEAALFPEKEYVNGIAVAVWLSIPLSLGGSWWQLQEGMGVNTIVSRW